jgi:LPXTG-motif cell wall-anchored protein
VVAHRQRGSTLLIAVGLLVVCLAIPATLVGAQAPAPAPSADVAATPQDPAEVPATQPQPSEVPPPDTQETQDPTTTPPAPTEPSETTTPAPAPAAQVRAASSASVAILDGNSQSAFRFSPSSLSVNTGDTVTWTNNGAEPHDVTGDSLASGTLDSGQSYSHTFASAGTYSYICSIHPFMKGSVTVAGSGGGGGSADSGSKQDPSASTGTGSESSAITSPDAAGSSTQLPSTGMPVLPLLAVGVGLLVAGALLRRRARLS